MQSILIWVTSLLMGGYPAAVSLALSCLSVILMWIFSLSFSIPVGFLLPLISSSPVPFVANPWLVVGLFAAPAFLGALTGQHLGYLILHSYLSHASSKRMQNLSPVIQADVIKFEAERWLFKAGFVQWFVLLMVGNYYKIGSSYVALVWLVSPAFACKFAIITFLAWVTRNYDSKKRIEIWRIVVWIHIKHEGSLRCWKLLKWLFFFCLMTLRSCLVCGNEEREWTSHSFSHLFHIWITQMMMGMKSIMISKEMKSHL